MEPAIITPCCSGFAALAAELSIDSRALDMTFWTIAEALADRFPELKADVESHLLEYWDMNTRPYPHEFLEGYLLPLPA